MDKPWIIKKKGSSLLVDKQSEINLTIRRDKRLASIDSQAKLAELVEGDKDLNQVQTKVTFEKGSQLSDMRMRKGIKLLDDSAVLIRSGGKVKNLNKTVNYSRLQGFGHNTSTISLSSIETSQPSQIPEIVPKS